MEFVGLIAVYLEDADLYAESYLVVNHKIHVSLSARTCLTNGTHGHSLGFILESLVLWAYGS